MPQAALTDANLRSLPFTDKGQRDVWDGSLKGFGVRIGTSTKTFILNINNSRRTLGRYGVLTLQEARSEAKRILAERTLGRVLPRLKTYPEARDEFLKEKEQTRKPSTVKSLRRCLNVHFPQNGKLTALTEVEMERRINAITAPSERNHTIVIANNFFNWCVKKKRYLTQNPCSGLVKTKRKKRGRVLTDNELRDVWFASDSLDLPAPYRAIIKLLILTGQRRGEIAAFHPSYYSHNQQTICLPAELCKNNCEHTFPAGPLTRNILHSLLPCDGLFFPARGKSHKPFNGWSKSKVLLDEISGVSGWTLHDLRRTYKTNMSRLGVAPHISERLLNHVTGQNELERTYDLYRYLPEMRAAMNLWEAHLAEILA